MDLLKVLLTLTILIAFPLGEILKVNLPNSINFTFLDIGVFFSSAVWFIQSGKAKKIGKKLMIPIFIFVSVALLSLIINFGNLKFPELITSFLYLIRWTFYASISFIVLGFDNKFKYKISNLMVYSGGFFILGGFIQYLFYSDLRNLRYAGWDEHLFRLFSSFLDPNFAGIFFVLYFLFVLNLFFENKRKLIFGVLLLLSFISIFLTFSRSALISLVVGALVISLLEHKKKTTLVIIIGVVISVVLSFNFPLKSEGTNILRIASGEARVGSVKNAFTIFKDHPVLGVGFDSYRYVQRKYGFISKNWESVHSGAGTDNSFLFVLATTGIVGFLVYLYMWREIINFSKSPILVSSLIAVFVNSLFINSLFYTFIMFWIWMLVGLKKNS